MKTHLATNKSFQNKMKTKTLLVLICIFFIDQLYGYNPGDEHNNYTNFRKTQLSIYSGFLISSNITDAHGFHGTTMGEPNDITVEGIKIQQNWEIGINTKFYLYNNFNLQLDLLYSNSIFPDQEVVLDNIKINQPESDLNFFTLSAGPGFRYSDDGLFRSLNPYAFISLSVLLGYANNVNSFWSYGKGGTSFLSGIGYNLNIGTQYHINNFFIAVEYRFEYLDSKVDYFRSFTEGLSFIKSSSYIHIGFGHAL